MSPHSISATISHQTTEPLCPLILFQLAYPTILQNLYVPSFYFSLDIPSYFRTSMYLHSVLAWISHTTESLCHPILFQLAYPPHYRTFMSPNSVSDGLSDHTTEHTSQCPLILFSARKSPLLKNLYVPLFLSCWLAKKALDRLLVSHRVDLNLFIFASKA